MLNVVIWLPCRLRFLSLVKLLLMKLVRILLCRSRVMRLTNVLFKNVLNFGLLLIYSTVRLLSETAEKLVKPGELDITSSDSAGVLRLVVKLKFYMLTPCNPRKERLGSVVKVVSGVFTTVKLMRSGTVRLAIEVSAVRFYRLSTSAEERLRVSPVSAVRFFRSTIVTFGRVRVRVASCGRFQSLIVVALGSFRCS